MTENIKDMKEFFRGIIVAPKVFPGMSYINITALNLTALLDHIDSLESQVEILHNRLRAIDDMNTCLEGLAKETSKRILGI